jgi:O-antigen/teichoic acid export membrane protein
VPSVVATNLLPRIAKSDDTSMTAAVIRTMAVIWGAVCLASIPIAIFGIPLLLGHRYDEAASLYVLLAPGAFFLGLNSALMAHYWIRGYPRSLIIAWTVALVVNVVANLVLLDPLGVTIAPIISSVTYGAVLLVHLVVFAREAGGWGPLRPEPAAAVRMVRDAFGHTAA